MKSLKTILVMTILLLALCGCGKKTEVTDERITDVETAEISESVFLSSFTIDDHQIYLYQPKDTMRSDLINYGYSAPLLLVFADGKTEKQEAVRLIEEKGIDRIAQKNGGFVVFVNPLTDWKSEEEGIYEKILAKTAVAQTGFSHGLLYDSEKEEYYLFASPALTCLYGYGRGGDYVAQNYLKEVKGTSSMSSLGSDDITPTAAVLERLSNGPKIEDRNIIIVSVNNPDHDEKAARQSDHYHISDVSFDQAFEEYIAGYQRWNGRLSETFYPGENGIIMEPLVFEVNRSGDNRVIKETYYQLGAVVFRKEDGSEKKKPLVMCFHGGGDTAITTASIAGWPKIAAENDFILCAIEMHMRTTATETIEVIEQLKQIYPVDETRIYATGFSMGGIKTWDLYQEYPEVFAALAPMGATVNVGMNTQFASVPEVNEDVLVPLFYSGGENSPLNELPFQSRICVSRVNYLFKVNEVEVPFELSIGNRSEWTDSVYGHEGDIVEEYVDEAYPESLTKIRYYRSADGNVYTALCSIWKHQHEIRPFTCEKAWEFMKRYHRSEDGEIIIDESY